MTEQENPRPTSSKDFQEEVVKAIAYGDLDAFKKCCDGKNDINQRLLQHEELKAQPKYNPYESYINIRGPTMLMYAILCERNEIVEYILECKNPNVKMFVEGYNCLHLAAMIKDSKCLKLLLQHKWIQDNIDIPLNLPDSHARVGEGTTALHLAVSNRRYANVFLLLDKMPKARWPQKKANQRTEEEEEENEDYWFEYSANVNKKSDSGSIPLHIAVSLCDYKMVRILLSAIPDTDICDAKGRRPLELAHEYQYANNEKRWRLQNPPKIKKDDDIDLIVNTIHKLEFYNEVDPFEVLMKIYAPELIDHTDESKQEKEPDPSLQKNLYQIFDQLQKIHDRISNLEMQRGASGDNLGQINDQLQELNSKVSYLEKQKGVLGDNSEEPENK